MWKSGREGRETIYDAANPNAGLHEYAFGVGLGAGFGGYMPVAGALDFGGTLGGGGIEWAAGGQFYGQGMQWGGLAGSIVGGGLDGGWRTIAWQAGGAGLGGGIGYGVYGTPEGALLGANFGAMGGGIGRGMYGGLRGNTRLSEAPSRACLLAFFEDARFAATRTVHELGTGIYDVTLLPGRGISSFWTNWRHARTGRRLINFSDEAVQRAVTSAKARGLTPGTTVFGDEVEQIARAQIVAYARNELGLKSVYSAPGYRLPGIRSQPDIYWEAGRLNIEITLQQTNLFTGHKGKQNRDFLSRGDRLAIITGRYED